MRNAIFTMLLAAAMLPVVQTNAQDSIRSAKPEKSKYKTPQPVAIEITAGTTGMGANIKWGISKKLTLRGGASTLLVNAEDVYDFAGLNSNNGLKARFTNTHLLADYTPFKGNGFRLTAGLAYFIKADAHASIQQVGDFKFGDIVYTAAQFGNLDADISWKGLAPYAGIGLFRGFPSGIFNITLDMGTYYLTAPQGHITGSGTLADNSQNDKQLTSNAAYYRWWPVIQLNFNFKL